MDKTPTPPVSQAQTQALAVPKPREAPGITLWGFSVANIEQALAVCKLLADTDFVPAAMRGKPGAVFGAIQLGSEIGLAPVQALQSVCVINGRPSVWGDGVLGLVLGSGTVAKREEPTLEEVLKTGRAEVRYWRRGIAEPYVGIMTRAMAEARQTWEKGGRSNLWAKWERGVGDVASMLLWRARHQAWRAGWADVLKGVTPVEVARDYDTVAETPEGIELQRPRAKTGTATGGPEEAANPWAGIDQAAKAAAPTTPPSAQAQPGRPQAAPEPTGPNPHVGKIRAITKTSSGKGAKWTRYLIEMEDGAQFSTFSGSVVEQARELGRGLEVEVAWEAKGEYRNATAVRPHLPDQSDATEPPEGEAEAEGEGEPTASENLFDLPGATS